MNKIELRAKGRTLEPNMNIGKNGLTDSVIEQIKTQLRQKKLIKIKMLPALSGTVNKKEVAKELAEKTGSVLIDHIGFTYVLADKSIVG